MNFPAGFEAASESSKPLGIEIALVTPSVVVAHTKALAAGGAELKKPEAKPWRQVVSYIRCPDGTLVEICSSVDGKIAAFNVIPAGRQKDIVLPLAEFQR